MAKNLAKSYAFRPALMLQRGPGSELVVSTGTSKGGNAGWQSTRNKVDKRCPRKKRAKTKMTNKKALKTMRGKIAEVGGGVYTGSGSTAVQVRDKESRLRRCRQKHGRWPSQRHA